MDPITAVFTAIGAIGKLATIAAEANAARAEDRAAAAASLEKIDALIETEYQASVVRRKAWEAANDAKVAEHEKNRIASTTPDRGDPTPTP